MGCSCSNAKKQVQPVSQDEAQASSVEAWSKDETKPEAKPEGTPVAKPTEQPDGQDAQRPVQQTPEQKATTESPPPNELPGEVPGAPGSVELYEVDLTESSFDAFAARMPEVLRQTVMCSWSDLDEAIKICSEEDAPMKDFKCWTVGSSDIAEADAFAACCIKAGAATPVGLVLCFGVVAHDRLEPAITAIRAEMMKALPISSLRLTLWYRDVDGSFELDKTAENAIKGCGFRWFQLTNTADQRRGQVMQTRRSPDDPPLPETT
jgi:hypothetical protein